jgi:hypothetical protein
MIGEPAAQLSVPLDAKGPCVLARLPRTPPRGDITLVMLIDDEQVEVPVLLSDDFQQIRLLAGKRAASPRGSVLLAKLHH